MAGNIGHNRLKSFVERIERLKDEQDALKLDVREVYAEAKGEGYDKTALGQVVAIRRKRAKDSAGYAEQSALVQLYLDTLDNGNDLEHAHAHEARPRSNPEPTPAGEADGTLLRTAEPGEQPVLMQEPHVEAEGQGRVSEHGRVEGSQARLPSDPAENKADGPSVIAAEPFSNPASSPPVTGDTATALIPAVSPTPFSTQTIDGLEIEQPDDIPGFLRRYHG